MAIPKVFVSSTCYDLQEERAQVERFIASYGFHPILSEYSGVYYDVDAHTHESCVNEIVHCDLFILIISGRYGGEFKDGNGESITQAEYNKARELGIPIFTFVKADVLSAQHYFKENVRANSEEFARKINYPAIQKQSDAFSIFSFIDAVHRASTNNGLETYQSFSDIEAHLKKQWAGMFFSFLQKRKEQDKVEEMTSVLAKLSGSSSKLEVLVSSLHNKELGEAETSKLLEKSKKYTDGVEFYSILLKVLNEASWEINNKEEREAFIVESTRDIPTTQISGDLAEYLNKIPEIRFMIQGDSKKTSKGNFISFTKQSSAEQVTDSTYEKLIALYETSLKQLEIEEAVTCFEEAIEKYKIGSI